MMALRNEHGKLRLASDRLKDVPVARTGRLRDRNHDERGRFPHGNDAATGRGFKAIIKRSLGPLTGDENLDELVREAVRIYAAFVRELPADGALIRSEAAAAARREVMAAYFNAEAIKAGPTSKEGMALADLAARHDQAASRHRTAARAQANLKANEPKPMREVEAVVVDAETANAFAESLAKVTGEKK